MARLEHVGRGQERVVSEESGQHSLVAVVNLLDLVHQFGEVGVDGLAQFVMSK